MSAPLQAIGLAQGDTLRLVTAVCPKCMAEFEVNAPFFSSQGLRVVRLKNRALVKQLQRNARKRRVNGCVGCAVSGVLGFRLFRAIQKSGKLEDS